MTERSEHLYQLPHIGAASTVKILHHLLHDGKRLVGVRHDGAEGLGTGLQGAAPVEGLGGNAVPVKLHAVGMSIGRFIRPFPHRNRTELVGVHAEVEPGIDVNLPVYLFDCGPRLIAPLYPKCEDFRLLEGSRL
jgi:hypothetical protein